MKLGTLKVVIDADTSGFDEAISRLTRQLARAMMVANVHRRRGDNDYRFIWARSAL